MNPKEVVFRTNSDSKSIILVTPSGVVNASEGVYGGYVLKPSQFRLNEFDEGMVSQLVGSARAFFVVPKIQKVEDLGGYAEVVRQYLDALPDKIREVFESNSIVELVTYKYVEVEAEVKKVTSRYAVLDFKPKAGVKILAKALRLRVCYQGSRRHPESTTAVKIVNEWKMEFPENEVLQKYVYARAYTGNRGRGSTIYLKMVVEAPRELDPTVTVAPTTETAEPLRPVVINGFLVVSRLPSKALLDATLPEIFKDTKIGKKEIRIVAGYFYNKLGSLSRKFYTEILPKYAVYAGFGYIVPKSMVPAFLHAIDKLKEEYKEYEEQLKTFLLEGRVPSELKENKRAKIDEEYVEIVMDFLRQHGKDEAVREKIESLEVAERVNIRLVPFSVDMRILEEYVDEKVRRRVEEELWEVRREMAEKVREQLAEKARRIIAKLEKYAESRLSESVIKMLRREVEEVEKQASELGVEMKELNFVKELVSAPIEEVAKRFATAKASGRVKALLEQL